MQSKQHSFIEAIANVLVGYGIAVLSLYLILLWEGARVSFGDSAKIGLYMTVISIARSYYLRRFFNWITIRSNHGQEEDVRESKPPETL